MSQNKPRIKRRVWIGLIVAAAAVGAWLAWNRARPQPLSPLAERPSPFVQLAGAGMATGDQVLREKAQLMDPTPLFFPTEWNFGQQPLRENGLKQPGQVFGSFEPKLTVDEQNITPYGGEDFPVPSKLTDVLVQGNEAPFAGMGQIVGRKPTLPVRSGFLEIRELSSSYYVIYQSLGGIAPPRSDFPPVEFILVVGSAGLIADPILTSGSGWEEVDSFFRSYLVKSYRVGERLAPGRYRVVVGA